MLGKISQIAALQGELDAAHARIAELETVARNAVIHDRVTGVLMLSAFREHAERELDRSRRSGSAVSVLMVDLDGFRALNGTHGAVTGDAALRGVAERLRDVVRSSDVIGRSGADELVVLLPDTDIEAARACASRLVEVLESGEIVGAGHVTVSAGVAQWTRDQTVDRLLIAAACGVDRARAAGGARVAAADDARDPQETARRDAHDDAIGALTMALLERDRYTGEHSESVVNMSRRVALSLGLQDDEVERIGAAALLHDIGKVAIPDEVLNKPAALNDAEWVLMREHPAIGERILRAVPGMGGVARIVRHEHERFDGAGYPDRLRGDAIPLGSRIILACDAYHAMTSDRPYRDAQPHGEAVRELARCAGTQFDPRVTEALIGHLHLMSQQGLLLR
jgi:diguanylate cyclase (GGDEF)-like protein